MFRIGCNRWAILCKERKRVPEGQGIMTKTSFKHVSVICEP